MQGDRENNYPPHIANDKGKLVDINYFLFFKEHPELEAEYLASFVPEQSATQRAKLFENIKAKAKTASVKKETKPKEVKEWLVL